MVSINAVVAGAISLLSRKSIGGDCRLQTPRILRGATLGHQSRGFTLLETFVALVILAFALAGLSMLMLGNMQTGLEARRATAAGALAQQKLEELRAAGYTGTAISTSSDTVSETGATTGVTPFTRTWTVAAGSISETKNLTITVAWSDQLGSHQVQLLSILAK